MAELTGEPAELRMTIEVKRADNGKIETVELVGIVQAPEPPHEELA